MTDDARAALEAVFALCDEARHGGATSIEIGMIERAASLPAPTEAPTTWIDSNGDLGLLPLGYSPPVPDDGTHHLNRLRACNCKGCAAEAARLSVPDDGAQDARWPRAEDGSYLPNPDDGAHHFDVIRSLTTDPEIEVAVDVAEVALRADLARVTAENERLKEELRLLRKKYNDKSAKLRRVVKNEEKVDDET